MSDTEPTGAEEQPSPSVGGPDDEISLLDLLIFLAKHKRMILSVTFVAAIISLVVAFLLPKIYTGTAVLMPPQQDQSTATALVGQLLGGGSGGGSGIAAALGLKNPNDLYVGLLRSRTIADRLIDRFKLQELYDEDTLVETREELEDNTTITAGKDGLIKIEFEDEDPTRAAAVANAYVEELEKLTERVAIQEASRRRLYYDEQLKTVKRDLTNADLSLKAVQERTGLIKLDEQAKAIFGSVAALRGAIAAKEIEIAAMKSFATERNPDFLRVEQELAAMRLQLKGLERDNALGGGDILVPTGKVPSVGLEFLQKYRDVKYYEALYEFVSKQLELARIEEGKNATIIQQVDVAVIPDKKSKPKRALIVILSVLLADLFLFAWIVTQYLLAIQIASTPGLGHKLRSLLLLMKR